MKHAATTDPPPVGGQLSQLIDAEQDGARVLADHVHQRTERRREVDHRQTVQTDGTVLSGAGGGDTLEGSLT